MNTRTEGPLGPPGRLAPTACPLPRNIKVSTHSSISSESRILSKSGPGADGAMRMSAALKHSSSRSVGLWIAMVFPLLVPSTHVYQTGWFLLRKTQNEWHTEVTAQWVVLKSSWASVRNSLTRIQSSCQEMTFKWLLTWALWGFGLIFWVILLHERFTGEPFLSCFPPVESSGSKGLPVFSLLCLFRSKLTRFLLIYFENFESSLSLILRHHFLSFFRS